MDYLKAGEIPHQRVVLERDGDMTLPNEEKKQVSAHKYNIL